MAKKTMICFLVVAVFAITGFTQVGYAKSGDKTFNFTMGTMNPPTDPTDLLMVGWEKWIERQSNGRIKITHLTMGSA